MLWTTNNILCMNVTRHIDFFNIFLEYFNLLFIIYSEVYLWAYVATAQFMKRLCDFNFLVHL